MVIFRLPIFRFELTVISRLVKAPLVTTRPLVVPEPNPTESEPTEGTVTEARPLIAKKLGDEL